MSMEVDTSDHIYDDFSRILYLHVLLEASALKNELPEDSDQFRFLRASCLNVGLLYHYRVLFDNFFRSSFELFYSEAKKPSQMVGNVSFTLDPYNDPTSQKNKY